MSLLEELFLEDEAGEAERLERVLEGGGDSLSEGEGEGGGPRGESEAEEEKVRVDPTQPAAKRVVKNPRVVLNPARLTGPRGIQAIPGHFKDFKFKGKGHEKEDLDLMLKKLEHWAHRLYPRFQFDDCLKKIEQLGGKRPVAVQLRKIRSDQILSDEIVQQKDSSDEEAPTPAQEDDEFDKLLQQQIELARATPGHSSAKKPFPDTPGLDRSTLMPKATSSPSISDDQKQRMLRNRQLAEERRLARMRQNVIHNPNNSNKTIDLTEFNPALTLIPRTIIEETIDITEETDKTDALGNNEETNTKSKNISIDSSDDEMEILTNKRTTNQRIISDSSDEERSVFNEVGNARDDNGKEQNIVDDFDMLATGIANNGGENDSKVVKDGKIAEKVTTYNKTDSSDEDFDMHDRNGLEIKAPGKETDNLKTNIDNKNENSDGTVIKNAIFNKTTDSSKELMIHYSDSSDEECEVTINNTSVIADVHRNPIPDTQPSQNDETNKYNDENVQVYVPKPKDDETNNTIDEHIEVNSNSEIGFEKDFTKAIGNKEHIQNELNNMAKIMTSLDNDNKSKEITIENENESTDFEMGDVELNLNDKLEA